MAVVFLSPVGGAAAQFFNNSGVILSGGKLYTYAAGTTTPQATYTTNAGNVARTNPIILDSAGRVPDGGEIWLTDLVSYKFVLKDSTDVLIATYDNVTGIGNTSALLAYEVAVAASSGSSLVGFLQSGTGAVATTVQAKLRQIVSVMDFGATGNGTTNDAASIQAAINSVSLGGGGKVYFPQGKYNTGTTGLVIYQNIILCGEVTRYAGSTTRGVSLIYTGSGNAIYGENLLDAQILDLDIDCTESTGTYPTGRGIYLNGCWKSTLRNVTVRGLTLAKGYAIAIDTNTGGPTWGAQHNYLEQIEVADGTILFYGVGVSDGTTTTVCNTIRGYQYEIASSQVVFINSTAEGWSTGIGFNFYGVGCYGLMLGCDIEGAGSPGINIGGGAEVREMGTIWAGFSGAVRVNGYMASMRSYGGAFEWNADLTVGVPAQLMLAGNKNVSNFVSEFLYPVNVGGGTQDGYRLWKRLNTGVDIIDHNWQQHAFLQKPIITTSIATVPVFIVPIPSGTGLRLSAHANGTQIGDGPFSLYRDCVVINNAGTLTITQGTQQTAGAACTISFDASGSNLLVNWTPSTANASTNQMNLEIRGPWTSYS